MTLRTRLVGLALALGSLSACGLRGELAPAPPVFGPAKAEYDAAQAKAEAEKAAADAAKAKPVIPARP